ncbi:hypothetical protein [Kitasatospora sp. NPDC051914]|uniref:hypothetical protein n=1 Tax=Kitasatospora sp. NPDC051914 TaxID=3154945 RepID=UPI00341CE689
MTPATSQDDLLAPYRSGDFAAARRRVRQIAREYCAAAAHGTHEVHEVHEAYERVLRTMLALMHAPNVLSGPTEGSAAAEAFVDGVVMRKLLADAEQAGAVPDSAAHLETFRHGIWSLEALASSCAGRLDRGHDHGRLVASVRKLLATYHRRHDFGAGTDLSTTVTGLGILAGRLAEAGDLSAARPAAKMIVQLRRRQVHAYGAGYHAALAASLHRLAAACEQDGDARGADDCRAEAAAL